MVKIKSKKPLAKKSLDEFLSTWSDDDDDDDVDEVEPKVVANGSGKKSLSMKSNGHSKPKTNGNKQEHLEAEEASEEDSSDEAEEDEESEVEEEDEDVDEEDEVSEDDELEGSDEEEVEPDSNQQKRYLASLKSKDPEFFKFLKENDEELLQFNESTSDDDEEEDMVHQLPTSLEVASDDSDFEEDDDVGHPTKAKNAVTKKMVDSWSQQLVEKPSVTNIADVVAAFRSAVAMVAESQQEQQSKSSGKTKKKQPESPKGSTGKFIVEGSTVFNAIIQLCLDALPAAFGKVLSLGAESSRKAMQPKKSKQWPKVKKFVKQYTSDLLVLMQTLDKTVQGALLKHVQSMAPYFLSIPKNAKLVIKALIQQWSTANDEGVRVLAFMGLLRIARVSMANPVEKGVSEEEDGPNSSVSYLSNIFKDMYMAYVINVKFTSPTTWPVIHFMRRSLAEMYNLCHVTAYRYAFIFIRQMAIHLRNAMIQSSKDKKSSSALDSVYNWHFVHSCHLWTQLLSDSHPSEALEPLIYPLVQVISAAIRLVYTPKYYPLRFHLCNQLIQLSSFTKKFIPILPYYVDILNKYNFSKKNSKVSKKPLDFSSCIKVSKSELTENGFKDATVEQIYSGMFEYLHSVSHKISFPEMVVPLTYQLRIILKSCEVANYTKKFKQVLDKTIENGKFIMDKRRKVTFGVRDLDQIQAWEESIRVSGTPISKFYTSFRKSKEAEQMKNMLQGANLDDYSFIPKLQKKLKDKSGSAVQSEGLLSNDDHDDDIDDDERFKLKDEREKLNRKRKANDAGSPQVASQSNQQQNSKKAKKVASPASEAVVEGEDDDDEVEDLDWTEFSSGDEDDEDTGGDEVNDEDEVESEDEDEEDSEDEDDSEDESES